MNDENLVAIVSTEGAIKRAVRQVRAALRGADQGSEFEFEIHAKGRVQEGEVKLSFKLADGYYAGVSVTGNSVQGVLDEYLRRQGWTKRNAPLAIAFNGDTKTAAPGDE